MNLPLRYGLPCRSDLGLITLEDLYYVTYQRNCQMMEFEGGILPRQSGSSLSATVSESEMIGPVRSGQK